MGSSVFLLCALIPRAEPTPELGEPGFRKWGSRYLEVLTHKDKLPQCRICAVLVARKRVFHNLVHYWADCALWQVPKQRNLYSRVVKNMPNRRIVLRVLGALCLRGWKALACVPRANNHCWAANSPSRTTASVCVHKSYVQPSLSSFLICDFLGSSPKTCRKHCFSSFFA